MKNKRSDYFDVMIYRWDGIKNRWIIDTWKKDSINKESVIVGYINLSGNIDWKVNNAKNDPMVKEKIDKFMTHVIFSIKDTNKIANKLFNIFKSIHCDDKINLEIIASNCAASYGLEKFQVLGNIVLAAGMIDTEFFRITSSCSDEEIENLVNWLLEDIREAVGEEYAIIIFD